MSSTLLRLGLWILILTLGLYVLQQSHPEEHWMQSIPGEMMIQAMGLSVLLIIAGIILRIFDKGARAVVKNRCAVCRTAIPSGAIYCREHLRTILHEEDDKTHMTRLRR